jgi:hypothetical protein
MTGDRERIASLEANQRNTDKTVDAIFEYMKDGKEQREKMIAQLAVVVDNQIDMKLYQDRCDAERTAHDKRITEVEGFQKRQIRIAVLAGGFGSFLALGGSKVIEKVLGVFS